MNMCLRKRNLNIQEAKAIPRIIFYHLRFNMSGSGISGPPSGVLKICLNYYIFD